MCCCWIGKNTTHITVKRILYAFGWHRNTRRNARERLKWTIFELLIFMRYVYYAYLLLLVYHYYRFNTKSKCAFDNSASTITAFVFVFVWLSILLNLLRLMCVYFRYRRQSFVLPSNRNPSSNCLSNNLDVPLTLNTYNYSLYKDPPILRVLQI